MEKTIENAERQLALNKALLDGIEKLDPDSEDYCEQVRALTALAAEINAGDKLVAEENSEAARIDVEYEKNTEEERANKKREAISIVQTIVSALTGIAMFVSNIWMFKRSTNFEDSNNSYLKKTDQTVVSDGLRGRFFDWIKK